MDHSLSSIHIHIQKRKIPRSQNSERILPTRHPRDAALTSRRRLALAPQSLAGAIIVNQGESGRPVAAASAVANPPAGPRRPVHATGVPHTEYAPRRTPSPQNLRHSIGYTYIHACGIAPSRTRENVMSVSVHPSMRVRLYTCIRVWDARVTVPAVSIAAWGEQSQRVARSVCGREHGGVKRGEVVRASERSPFGSQRYRFDNAVTLFGRQHASVFMLGNLFAAARNKRQATQLLGSLCSVVKRGAGWVRDCYRTRD